MRIINFKIYIKKLSPVAILIVSVLVTFSCKKIATRTVHEWETVEISFEAQNEYTNPYTEVEMWVVLTGPNGYKRRVWGFWDGKNTYKVRILGNKPGIWHWQSYSNQDDAGLNNFEDSFTAIPWTSKQKEDNQNRKGFIETTQSGRAWQYKDGTPFYMLADSWWGAGTWRYPYNSTNQAVIPVSIDSTNFSFASGLQWLKNKGFNSIGIIVSIPNWSDDGGKNVYDNDGILLRSGKTPNGDLCMTMHSDGGHRAFRFPGKSNGKNDICPDYDRLNPEYYKDLDEKMFYLNENGFVPYVETIRRDASPAWEKYYSWPESFSRYINYIAARYGTINMIFSLVHYDIVDLSISAEKWDEALDHWYKYYTDSKGMPFGQPTVLMGAYSTYEIFGHITENPWLQAHSVGNRPKDHTMEQHLERAMKIEPPVPGYCNEPYYVGWIENRVNGETVEMNSDRDNYFARSHAYGHMMNGGLAGHIIGTGSRWCIGPGEKYTRAYPPPWESLNYDIIDQARFIPEFLMSEGPKYQYLQVANEDLPNRIRDGFTPQDLEGWAHVVKTPDKKMALVYFEQQAQKQTILNLKKDSSYRASWFNPRTGDWINLGIIKTNDIGSYTFPDYPEGGDYAIQDWAAKLILMD